MTENSTKTEYFASTVAATEYEPFLVDGDAVGEVHWIRSNGSDDSTLIVGLWKCEPDSFPYPFGNDETIHALDGELEIALESGEVVTLTAGDVASFAKGTQSTWTVKSPFKKLFVISG
ncbi:cupin domain-containing protein [Rhodococcus sp. NPDC059968]|uniref:cupin domain-containing protein n=1 Tax=Rhodococcus sp. NPDC059968 TaxID=3347017 RepID=UPI00366D3698